MEELEKAKAMVNAQGIPDIQKLAEYRELEEWYKNRSKAAGKAEEVVTIARTIFVENPKMSPDECLNLGEAFHTAAHARVETLMEGYKDEDKPQSGLLSLT